MGPSVKLSFEFTVLVGEICVGVGGSPMIAGKKLVQGLQCVLCCESNCRNVKIDEKYQCKKLIKETVIDACKLEPLVETIGCERTIGQRIV